MATSNETDNWLQYTYEESYVKDYSEVEVEECLKYINIRDEKQKESKLDTTFQELEEYQQKSYTKDLSDVHEAYNLTYNSKDELSVISMKTKILSIIETHSVVIIQGPTGCGKTTKIPQFILEDNIKKRINCNIIVTQPRRIAAMSIAKRVCSERGWDLGSIVGYKVSMRNASSSETRLLYCTTEILLQHLIGSKHMLEFSHIILDEIHERDQNLDFLLLVVKRLLQTNSKQVKVILMSATIDVTKFAKYFSIKVENNLFPAPIIKIPEKTKFDVRIYYLDEIKDLGDIPEVSASNPKVTIDMIKFCSLIIDALDEIDVNDDKAFPERHAVLIFLPGLYEIEELYNYLSTFIEIKLWDLTILHSLISDDNEQNRIFEKPPDKYRRIILSTNIAESSITVPDIKYVIDFCLVKLLISDPKTYYQTLQLSWASKANCIQRAGRTGRVTDGRVFRLIPKAFYDNILEDYSVPEILRAPLANVILRAKLLDLDEPRIILSHSLDPPTLSNVANTILYLKEVGALVDEDDSYQLFDGKLTNMGRIVSQLPFDIRISKLILLGHVFGVLRDTIILAASMTVKDIFSLEQCHSTVSSYTTRKDWAYNSDSDCIAALHVYKMWQNEKANRRLNTYQAEKLWGQRNGFQPKALRELDALVSEITKRLSRLKITETVGINKVIWQGTDRDFVLQVVLAGAFYPNYFVKRLENQEAYKENITKILNVCDPMKTVYLRGWPRDQPGYLYAKKFQEIFSRYIGIPEKQIAISCNESQRIYIQFREKETAIDDSLQNISMSVYQAIMMRQCNIPIEINLLDAYEANQRAKHLDLHKFKRNLFFRRNVKKIETNNSKIRPRLPGLDVTSIPLFIQTIISPGYFWANLDNGTTRNELQVIEETLNKYPLKQIICIPKTLTMIAAPIEKNNSLTYHRAIITEFISEVGELVNIFFVDYGHFSRLRLSDLREINNYKILEIPPLAFACNLAFLQPLNRSNHHQWSEKSKNYFETQIKENKEILGKIYSVVDSIINLELIVVNEKGEEFSVNDGLIEKGYAVKKEESVLSIHNHELRDNGTVTKMSMEEKNFYEEEQYDKYLLQYPDPPKEEECKFNVKLQGPYSPLEMRLIPLTLGGRTKKIYIESKSVNYILLDNDLNQSRRLLVTQNITESNNGNNLTLRNTTFLPNIPGLAALVTLIFTPHMELRCNSRRTYYTGALCGLGPIDNYTSRGILSEHDILIQFDVEITMDDIKEINILRHWIDTGLELDDTSDENIIMCQNKIKHILLNIRDKQRKLRDLEDDEIDHRNNFWNLYKRSYLLSVQELSKKYDLYPPHKALELRETNEQKEQMIKHLSQLERLAHEDAGKMRNVVVFCNLCERKTTGLIELQGHLYSQEHVEKQALLYKQY